jgi:hypothetical protein
MLQQLGLSPTLGLLVNLVYSIVAVVLFGWLAQRWLTVRHDLRQGDEHRPPTAHA